MTASAPRFSHRLEYALLRATAPLLALIPRTLHQPLARALARVWFHVFPLRRGVALENLRIAFPEESEAWRRRTARRCFAHFLRMLALEFLTLRRGEARFLEAMFERLEGDAHYEAAGGDAGRFLFVSGHLGGWEFMISYFSRVRGKALAAVAKPMHNPLVEAMIARARAANGWSVFTTRGANPARAAMRALRAGKTVALLADQDARREGIFVPFFGRPAATTRGPSLLALRLGLPILVGCALRDARTGRYVLRFYEPILPDADASDRDAEIERLTRAHVALLEQAIRSAPEQYFWFHRRWKTRPKRRKQGAGEA